MSSRTVLRFSTRIPAAPAFLLAIMIASCSSSPTFRSPRKLPRSVSTGPEGTEETGVEASIIRAASAEEVARRALVLRSIAEVDLYPRADERLSPAVLERFEEERSDLVKWLEREGAWEAATEKEKEILSSKVGTRKQGGTEAENDERESLLVMLWALGMVKPMPPYDTPAPPAAQLGKQLPDVGALAGRFLASARLRPEEVIDHEWEVAELWRWRARAREVMRDKMFPQGKELDSQVQDLTKQAQDEKFRLNPIRDGETFFRELIRFASHHAHTKGLIPPPIDDDFPARRRGYADLTEREFARIRRIAVQRHRALNWILGRGEE
jgi:hypothetical protein